MTDTTPPETGATTATVAPPPPPPPSPRARRRAARRSQDRVPIWLRVVTTIVALYFVLPTLFVIPMSFSEASTFVFPPEGFTMRLYENFFTPSDSPSTDWLGSLGNSFLVAALSALLATVLGTAAALGLNRLTGRLSSLARALLMMPLVTPSIVLAVDIYMMFLQWRLVGSLEGYVLAHTAIALPFVLVSVTAALGTFDTRLLRAASSLGAPPWRSFLNVTVPLISRGIVAGAILAFVTSFDDVVIALFIRSPQFQTLPVLMFNSVTVEINPTLSAAASLIVVVVTLVFLLPQLFGLKRRR